MREGKFRSIDWYVVFTSSTLNHWVLDRLQEGFRHVYAVRLSDEGCFWIIVQPTGCVTTVDLLPVSMYPHIRLLVESDAVILPVKAKINPNKHRGNAGWFTCTEVVKSLLGIKDFWCITPWQLYKRLTNEHRT